MKLSKKQLLALITAHYEACAARGLAINQAFFRDGQRFVGVCLAPYGTAPYQAADLTHVYFSAADNRYWVQVLQVCPGVITAAAYHYARQYAIGLQQVLDTYNADQGLCCTLMVDTILIGAAVERSAVREWLGPDQDHLCYTFCYRFGVDGLWFEEQAPMRAGKAGAQLRLWDEPSDTLVVTATGVIDRREPPTTPATGTDGAN